MQIYLSFTESIRLSLKLSSSVKGIFWNLYIPDIGDRKKGGGRKITINNSVHQ